MDLSHSHLILQWVSAIIYKHEQLEAKQKALTIMIQQLLLWRPWFSDLMKSAVKACYFVGPAAWSGWKAESPSLDSHAFGLCAFHRPGVYTRFLNLSQDGRRKGLTGVPSRCPISEHT